MKGLGGGEEKTGGYILQQHQHHRYNRGIPAMVCVDVCVRVYVCDNVCMHAYVRLCVCVCACLICAFTQVYFSYISRLSLLKGQDHITSSCLRELCMLPSVQCLSALNTASSHRFTKTFIVCWRMVENKQLMTGRDRPQVTFQLPPAAAPSTAAPRLS